MTNSTLTPLDHSGCISLSRHNEALIKLESKHKEALIKLERKLNDLSDQFDRFRSRKLIYFSFK